MSAYPEPPRPRVRWSARWLALIDDATPQAALRVTRGRAYERSGRVTDLRVSVGSLTARVQGSRSTPYVVELGVPTLEDTAWARVVAAIADQVRHGARLLAGQAPEGLEEELEGQGIQLFPHPAEVVASCTCDDTALQCKHVIAVALVAADAIAEDPFLLLRLLGRGREQLLAELADARRRRSHGANGDDRGMATAALGQHHQSWGRARGPLEDLGLQDLALDQTPLDRLGDPPGWAGGVSARDLFGPLVDRGAAWAAEIAGVARP